MTDKYAVMGNPVEHSLSPTIHHLFAEQTAQDICYTKIFVELTAFEDELRNFQLRGGKGLSITLPFKQRAYDYVDAKTARAEQAGAVNTIIFQPNAACIGDNTDGIGLVRDLIQNHQLVLKNKRILLLGAGGAAHGVMDPLLQQAPQQLHIANRTLVNAQQLANVFNKQYPVTSSGFENIEGRFDLIINATAGSLQGELPPINPNLLAEGCCCYDMMYGKEPTIFLRFAKQQGAALAIDGLGMLVEQAAEAFLLWRHVMPQTQPVIAQLRGNFQ